MAEKTELLAAAFAFVMYLASGVGHIETWGLRELTRPRDMPRRIQDGGVKMLQLAATDYAFAAILEDKSVVTWGSPDHGGDSSAVKDELRHVEQMHPAKGGAFAAILADRSVVTWGHPSAGGDSFEIHGFLADFADVDQIQGSYGAFAAILEDRKSVV